MTLFLRLAIIAFPNPEDTITVGTAGCGRLVISGRHSVCLWKLWGHQRGSQWIEERFDDPLSGQAQGCVVLAEWGIG